MEPIGRCLEPRAHLLTNKARLDRLLMLMRRIIADPAGALSLHDGIRPRP